METSASQYDTIDLDSEQDEAENEMKKEENDIVVETIDQADRFGSDIAEVTKYGYVCYKEKTQEGAYKNQYETRLTINTDRFPSANNMYSVYVKHGKPCIVKSYLVRTFCSHVRESICSLIPENVKLPVYESGELAVSYVFFFPDRRKRDLDNHMKVLNDALIGIIWKDDSQVHEALVKKKVDLTTKHPYVRMHILYL